MAENTKLILITW